MQQALTEVSNILWRERRLLELLVFKLEEEQLVLAAGRSRWLPHATREVETVLAQLKRLELERAIQVEHLAGVLGRAGNPSLRELATSAPAPWDNIFSEHRRALMELAAEIDGVAKANRDLLSRGQQATREALAAIGEIELDTYTPTGSSTGERTNTARLIDEAM